MILIKNAKIVDGTGAPARQGDILISGDRISAIGHFPNKKTETVIEALGMYVAPGFIARETSLEQTFDVFEHPAQEMLQKKGITTLVTGVHGLSLAPLLYEGTYKKNISWQSVRELGAALTRIQPGVNIATLVGYETVRRAIIPTGVGDATDKERVVIARMIRDALREGAMGISITLHTPYGASVPHHELIDVLKVSAAHGKSAFVTFRGAEKHYGEAASELLRAYKTTGATMLIMDSIDPRLTGTQIKECGAAYERLERAGDNIYTELAYRNYIQTPLAMLLPIALRHSAHGDICAALKNPAERKKIAAGIERIPGMRVKEAPKEYRTLIDKTPEDIARTRGISFRESVLMLMEMTKLNAVLEVPDKHNEFRDAHVENACVIGGGDPEQILEAAERVRMPIEAIIPKITALPARLMNIERRGSIRENYYADVVIINDRHTVMRTIINGVEHGRAGRFLKHV